MAAVQFYGKEQVFEAASNLKCPAWALFSGTSLFTKYEDADSEESLQMLEQALDMLQSSGSAATYKLKFFEIEEGQKKRKINEKTVCDGGSFSFKLQNQEQTLIPYQARTVAMTEQQQRIDKLAEIVEKQEAHIQLLVDAVLKENEEEEEEEPETIGTVLIDAIKNPNKLMELVNTFKAITGIGMNYQPAQAIGNIPAAQTNATMEPGTPMEQTEERLQRLGAAIDILEKADPLLVEHLEKLAAMSQTDPSMFNFLLSRL